MQGRNGRTPTSQRQDPSGLSQPHTQCSAEAARGPLWLRAHLLCVSPATPIPGAPAGGSRTDTCKMRKPARGVRPQGSRAQRLGLRAASQPVKGTSQRVPGCGRAACGTDPGAAPPESHGGKGLGQDPSLCPELSSSYKAGCCPRGSWAPTRPGLAAFGGLSAAVRLPCVLRKRRDASGSGCTRCVPGPLGGDSLAALLLAHRPRTRPVSYLCPACREWREMNFQPSAAG